MKIKHMLRLFSEGKTNPFYLLKSHKKTIKSIWFFLLILFVNLIACQNKVKDPNHIRQDTYKNHVMAGYQETVPMLKEIRELKKKLNKIVENTDLINDENKLEIIETIELLEKMDKGITRWKASFTDPAKYRDQYTHKDIMDYLEKESSKIQSAKDNMESSIEQANNLVAKYDVVD